MTKYSDAFNFPTIRTGAERDAAKAEIKASKNSGQITAKQAKRQSGLVDVAHDAYQTSAAKSKATGGRSAS